MDGPSLCVQPSVSVKKDAPGLLLAEIGTAIQELRGRDASKSPRLPNFSIYLWESKPCDGR